MSTTPYAHSLDRGLSALRRMGHDARLLSLAACFLSILDIVIYGAIMRGMGPATFDASRTKFWIAFTFVLALMCLLAAATPWRPARGALLCGAAGGLTAAAVLSLFSVGPLYLAPALAAARALSETVPTHIQVSFYVGGAAGLLAVETILVFGLLAT
jgi:hypothetical protein